MGWLLRSLYIWFWFYWKKKFRFQSIVSYIIVQNPYMWIAPFSFIACISSPFHKFPKIFLRKGNIILSFVSPLEYDFSLNGKISLCMAVMVCEKCILQVLGWTNELFYPRISTHSRFHASDLNLLLCFPLSLSRNPAILFHSPK